MGRKNFLIITAIFAAAFVLFYPSLFYYFFQDDWFVLNWVKSNNFLSFFNFRTDIIYYRPLSMPLLFWIAGKIFALQSIGFHSIGFAIFFSLIAAVYKLFSLLFKNNKIGFVAAFLYGTWPIHFISLSWFSTTSYLMGPLFQCLSFIFYLKFIEDKFNKYHLLLSFTFFIFGLLSSEFTLIIPGIFLAWTIFYKKKVHFISLTPFGLTIISYLILRFTVFPIPATGSYKMSLSLQTLNNLIWYLLWAIGFPENFKTLLFFKLPLESFKNILHFWQVTFPILFQFALIIFIFLKSKKVLLNYLFGISWFIIGLLPVLALSSHTYPLYLSFAGLGLIYILVFSIKNQPKILLSAFLIAWFIVAFTNLKFTQKNHWVVNEQAISKSYVQYAKDKYINPNNGVFVVKPANKEFSQSHNIVIIDSENNLQQSLNGSDAYQVIFNNRDLFSIFTTHQKPVNLPIGVSSYEISPK